MKFILLILLSVSIFCKAQNADNKLINSQIPLKKLVDSLKIKKDHTKILVSKSKYILSIVIDTTIIKSYPVVFGFNPTDDKLREGDGCTPEGIFKIKAMYPHKSWSKFIWFDYPNEASRVQHHWAKEKGIIPKSSRIGGDVGIHGVPKGADRAIDVKQNWTLGCVSLKNNDIDELYWFSFVGMKVEIKK